jgi:predicted RNA-binding Zn-ribbon protein involved in translation (DUF1610 family)
LKFQLFVIFLLKYFKFIIMAILQYVPPTKKIIDNRNPNGNYYIAKCEVCNTEFYPARRNAKYCTPNCGLTAHRMAMATGGNVKKVVSKPKKEKAAPKSSGEVFRGAKTVYEWLSTVADVRRQKGAIVSMLKSLEINEVFNGVEPFSIKRISLTRYEVV